jgi:hypothetical protein
MTVTVLAIPVTVFALTATVLLLLACAATVVLFLALLVTVRTLTVTLGIRRGDKQEKGHKKKPRQTDPLGKTFHNTPPNLMIRKPNPI